MALTLAALKAEILKLIDPENPGFVGYTNSYAVAAANWATAFDNWASNAEDDSGDNPAVVFKALFQTALLSAWASSTTKEDGAQSFADAVNDYWTGGIFSVGSLVPGTGNNCANVGAGTRVFATEATSVVTSVTTAAIYVLLLGEFTQYRTSMDAKAQALAEAFYNPITVGGVFVTITGIDTTPPPAGPLPVTNVCGVH